MLCGNTFYLNEYEHKQFNLEKEWEMSKQTKREKCVELARKIVLQDVDVNTFNLTFGYYIDYSEDKYEWIIATLEDIEKGVCDEILKGAIIREALEGACWCLYDCELEEILDDRVSEQKQISGLISQVNL